VAFNPISALTGATLARMTGDPDVAALVRAIMTEAECVAGRLGMKLPVSIEQRMAGAAKVGEHKTSMLQDLEAGRPLELEAVVGAVLELGERLGVAMPATRAVYACTKLLRAKGGAGRRSYEPAPLQAGMTGEVQNAQRRAWMGIVLRHSGHCLVVGSGGLGRGARAPLWR
jgi:hypothetical protein